MMKKIFLLIILVFTALLSSCEDNENPSSNNSGGYFVEFTTETLNIYTFEEQQLPINTNAELSLITCSSSNEDVVKINDKTIIPVGKGTAEITASIENGKSDKLTVVVEEDGNIPFLEIDETEISLFVDSTYDVSPKVTLRGKEVAASFTYTSSDSSVLKVDEDGKLTALKAGVSYVNIVASYNSYTGDDYYSLKRTIEVKVEPLVILSISSKLDVINNRNDKINGIDYYNETELFGSLLINGQYLDIFASDTTWISTNPDVAYVEDNKILGKNVGTTTIFASKEVDGVTYTSNKISITVEKPTILVNINPIDIDLYVNNISIPNDFMLGNDKEILNIYDKEIPGVSIYDGKKLVDYDEIGPRKWIVESTNNNYLIDVISCSKIITTKDELGSLHTYGKNVIKGTSGIVSYDGYFILGNNIDMKGVRFRTFCGIGTGATSVLYNGFMGTFDGRGYTVDNASVTAGNGGLFGTMNRSAVIKNVAFTNVVVSGDSGLLSSNFGGRIENVYVEGKLTCTRATAASPSSLLASKIYDGAKIINCIIKITNPTVNNNYSSAIGMLVTAKEDALENFYVLGTDFKVFSTSAGDIYNILTNKTNGQFVNYSDLLNRDLTSFNNYWIFGDSGISFSASH